MPRHALPLLIAAPVIISISALLSPGPSLYSGEGLAASQRFERHLVVSQSLLASEIGARVLDEGGNAVDAAVATAFALAVVHPEAGNVGGGGFLLVWLPDGTATSFDFREAAPAASTADMFLDASGRYAPSIHHEGALSVGVPGSVAGLHLAHERLGKLPWRRLLEPAIEVAARGFPVTQGLAESLGDALPRMRPYPASMRQFTIDGRPLRAGDVLVQADLAGTLKRIRDSGPAGFYGGETADLIVQEMRRLGGRIALEDLRDYRAMERRPIRGEYRGYQVLGMPPPSSGGVTIVEMLNILEGHDLRGLGFGGPRSVHLMAEAMRRAFADRARYLGDSDLETIPVERLTSKEHAARLRETIRPTSASRSSPESFEWPAEGSETTHLSAVDSSRMAVSLTTTLEQAYGSCIVVPGAGFLLNNEMGDFNPRAGLTTPEGLIGTEPNLVEPRKRMLSSMSPTIVLRDGRPVLIVGSPGGRTIINTVLEIIVSVVDHGMGIQEAIDRPRFHHQWLPDRIRAEPLCFSPETREALEALGHRIEETPTPQGSAMGIAIISGSPGEPDHLEAGVDRRRPDAGSAGR